MSGGSYNYLCYRDASDIADHKSDVESMRDRLSELGFEDAAQETQKVLDALQLINSTAESLHNVWRTVEWADSGDYLQTDIQPAIEKWRAK